MSLQYGILGGTFDPPHLGHLLLAQVVHSALRLDRVWFVPTGEPPHKRGRVIAAASHRLAMVERAIAGDERFAVSAIELTRPGPSYTVDTLRLLRAEWGREVTVTLIIGWDMLAYLPQWHDAAGVVQGADRLAAVHRPGTDVADATIERVAAVVPGLRRKLVLVPMPQIDISSTMIRERVARNLPTRYFVPDLVDSYLREQGLYRDVAHESAEVSDSSRTVGR